MLDVFGDTLQEADETITLGLRNPSAGDTVGTAATATHLVGDDDSVPQAAIPTVGSWAAGLLVFALVALAVARLRA